MIGQLITMSTSQGLAFGLALIAVGMVVQAGLNRWADDVDPMVNEPLVADQDQAIALTTPAVAPEPTLVIPVQRVTNGEDMLGGGLR